MVRYTWNGSLLLDSCVQTALEFPKRQHVNRGAARLSCVSVRVEQTAIQGRMINSLF
jgi:hypothetical protein